MPSTEVRPFETLPARILLDTNVVNLWLDFGEQIHDFTSIPHDLSDRQIDDIMALRVICETGKRAFWQLAVSPITMAEVLATQNPGRARELQQWFWELWDYWRGILASDVALPGLSSSEHIRLQVLTSPNISVLPDINDRLLLADAIVYGCDVFCTRDWSTILKHRTQLADLPIRILSLSEWCREIEPWEAIWC